MRRLICWLVGHKWRTVDCLVTEGQHLGPFIFSHTHEAKHPRCDRCDQWRPR